VTTEKGEMRRRLALCRILSASGYMIVERRRSGIRILMVERLKRRRGGHRRRAVDWIAIAFAKARRWRASFFNGSAKPLNENRTLLDPEERRG